MADEVIKDAGGRTLGFIRTSPNGRREAYDVARQYRGYHDAKNNLTKDQGGATAAKGNALAALIFVAGRSGTLASIVHALTGLSTA